MIKSEFIMNQEARDKDRIVVYYESIRRGKDKTNLRFDSLEIFFFMNEERERRLIYEYKKKKV